MKSRKSRKPGKKLPLQSIALGCTVLAAVLAGAWGLFPNEMGKAVKQLKQLPKTMGLQPETAQQPSPFPILKAEHEQPKAVAPSGLPAAEIKLPSAAAPPEQPASAAAPVPPPMTCSQAGGKLQNFLDGLDKQSYIQEFKLKKPLRKHLDGLKEQLTAKPPAVVRETDDLYTVLSNTAHFFRVIGKDNIQLLKSLGTHETDRLEDMAAALEAVSIGSNCPADTVQIPFNTAYDYAVFFLNTIGGRSYLFRREAKVRLLINYYAILLVDEANRRNLNTHGLDLSPLIPPLIRELEASNQLTRKEEYLARLRGLAAKYPLK